MEGASENSGKGIGFGKLQPKPVPLFLLSKALAARKKRMLE
jgi:hypothetical protein